MTHCAFVRQAQTTAQPSRQYRVSAVTLEFHPSLFDGYIVHIALVPHLDSHRSIHNSDFVCLERNTARRRDDLASTHVKRTLVEWTLDDTVFDIALT